MSPKVKHHIHTWPFTVGWVFACGSVVVMLGVLQSVGIL